MGSEPKPSEPKPVADKPAEPKPVAVKPSEPKPVADKPAEPKLVAVKPAEPKPIDVKPVAVKPAEPKPVADKPAEAKPEQIEPVFNKPAEPKPVADSLTIESTKLNSYEEVVVSTAQVQIKQDAKTPVEQPKPVVAAIEPVQRVKEKLVLVGPPKEIEKLAVMAADHGEDCKVDYVVVEEGTSQFHETTPEEITLIKAGDIQPYVEADQLKEEEQVKKAKEPEP